MSAIIVVTECPRFSDAGTHQRCELVSDDKKWVFYIPWKFVQQAMPACGEVLGDHFRKPSPIVPIKPRPRKGGPLSHG